MLFDLLSVDNTLKWQS